MNQTILDEMLGAFTRVLTSGWLELHPSVMLWMSVLLTAMLVVSMVICVQYAHQPYVLVALGAIWIRALVLVTTLTNWLTITDGMLHGLVSIGLSIGPGAMTPAEFLSPGRLFFLGAALSQNFVWLIAQMGSGWWMAPLLFAAYFIGSLLIWLVFALVAFFVMIAVIEFQLLSLYAFLAWPLMTVGFLAWIAGDLVRFLIASALRTSALAALMSIALPFVVEVAIGPEGDATVTGALSVAFGMVVLLGIIWVGPQAIGASSIPGRSLLQLGALTWIGLRRAA